MIRKPTITYTIDLVIHVVNAPIHAHQLMLMYAIFDNGCGYKFEHMDDTHYKLQLNGSFRSICNVLQQLGDPIEIIEMFGIKPIHLSMLLNMKSFDNETKALKRPFKDFDEHYLKYKREEYAD